MRLPCVLLEYRKEKWLRYHSTNSAAIFFTLYSLFSTLHSQLLQLPCDFCFSMGFQVIVCTAEMFVSEEAVVS